MNYLTLLEMAEICHEGEVDFGIDFSFCIKVLHCGKDSKISMSRLFESLLFSAARYLFGLLSSAL
jgi:hypothetical protein